jgi:hypothetical protein
MTENWIDAAWRVIARLGASGLLPMDEIGRLRGERSSRRRLDAVRPFRAASALKVGNFHTGSWSGSAFAKNGIRPQRT